MDVVYLCRRGQNLELKYSLRSLANVEHDRVWIFGGYPPWVSNVTIVQTPQAGPKYGVTTNALREACLDDEVSDPFWMWNDDMYAVAPAKPEHLHRGPVRDLLAHYEADHPNSNYTHGMRDTLERLEDHGYPDPLAYELHIPFVVHKEPMLEAIALGEGVAVWHKRTAYGNIAGIGGTLTTDVKIHAGSTSLPDGPWLSTDDHTFVRASRWIGGLFPNPCRYEAGYQAERLTGMKMEHPNAERPLSVQPEDVEHYRSLGWTPVGGDLKPAKKATVKKAATKKTATKKAVTRKSVK